MMLLFLSLEVLLALLVGCNREPAVPKEAEKVSMNLAFVLLAEPKYFKGEEVTRAFETFAAPGQQLLVKQEPGKDSAAAVLEFEFPPDGRALLVTMPYSVPNEEAEEGAQFSVSSIGTGWTLPKHNAHIVVNLRDTSSSSALESLSRFTSLLAAVVKASGAVGIYWGNAGATHDPEFFVSIAESPDIVPRILLWTGVSIANQTDGGVSILSLGMKQLDLPDLLLIAPKSSKDASLETFFELLGYAVELGRPIPEGETVGRSDAERLPVSYVPSPVDADAKVWRVEMK